ncbi:cytochrome C oxidase copper chaperone-domain-containing protein [Cladorrhinum samala]|uniref:Cytochrome C oxidase copper chaperone-domain-containing protein n=1 Tax=Cladorrhinum samala TaxID=585594 RepID=A0AAV9HB51_9PEZI|nr:cytochrome C oxidase copper chaperone-domain-containing protein [Cladorrhinum samala]
MSSAAAEACPLPSVSSAPPTANKATTDAAAASKPKPCCVCKEEKAKRDECMLFSNAADPQKDCLSTIDLYKSCMAGFGFKV